MAKSHVPDYILKVEMEELVDERDVQREKSQIRLLEGFALSSWKDDVTVN